MITQLKNNFMQTSFITTVWVLLLTTVTNFHTTVSIHYFWNMIAIAAIAGFVFGIAYPYLWSYSTATAPVNIAICTVLNVSMQFTVIYLFSQEMFQLIKPYMIGIVLITFIGHIIAFYFYKKHQNKKVAEELNMLNK